MTKIYIDGQNFRVKNWFIPWFRSKTSAVNKGTWNISEVSTRSWSLASCKSWALKPLSTCFNKSKYKTTLFLLFYGTLLEIRKIKILIYLLLQLNKNNNKGYYPDHQSRIEIVRKNNASKNCSNVKKYENT